MSAQTTISRPHGNQLRVGPVGIALVAIAGMLGGLGDLIGGDR